MSAASTRPVRILLVERHPIVRFRVREIVETAPDLSICAEADTHEAAVEAFMTSTADLAVVIVDLSAESAGGLELVSELHAVNPRLPMLVLSPFEELLFAEPALRAGARAYVMKQHANEGLIPAIRQVLAGRLYVSQRVLQEILKRIAGPTGRG